MKQHAERGGRETVKGTVSQSTHGSVIELRSDHLLTISAAKKNVHQSWTLACGHLINALPYPFGVWVKSYDVRKYVAALRRSQ